MWLFPEGDRKPWKRWEHKAFSLDFSFSKTPSLFPGGEGVGVWGSRAETGSCPSTAPPAQADTGWVAAVTNPPSDGRGRSWYSLPWRLWFLETPRSLAGPAGVAAARPGEAGVKRRAFQKSKDYRFASGLSLLSHKCPRTLLSLGSTVTAERCIGTPLGRPSHGSQLSGWRLCGQQVLAPLHEDSCGPCCWL